MASKSSNAAKNLSEMIAEVKNQLQEHSRQAAKHRAALLEKRRQPLVVEEPLAAARVELKRREAQAFAWFRQFFHVERIDAKAKYFDTDTAVGLENLFLASGLGSILLDKVAADGSPDAITSEQKDAAIAKEQAALDQVERTQEAARLQLQGLGLNILPDIRIGARNFLEYSDGKYNVSKLKWLQNQLDNFSRIGRELGDLGRRLHDEIVKAQYNLHRHRGTTDEKGSENQLAALNRQQQEQQETVQANNRERDIAGKILNSCQQFLKEKGIVV